MFTREHQYAVVHDFGVRVKDEREQDRNHMVEVGFEVPLTHELADEILPAMARDLFTQTKGEWVPRPEMREAVFNLAPPVQVMEVRNHPELGPETIQGVQIRKIKAVKGDGDVWLLRFTATWTLGNPTEAILFIQRLRLGVYLTMREQQPSLLPAPAAAESGDGGEAAAPKKGGRRKRTRPEDEAKLRQQQLQEGAARAAEDAGDSDDQPAADEPAPADPMDAAADAGQDDQPSEDQPTDD